MDLDFKSNKYDLFDDWHQNKTKQAFTQKLQQQAQIEKTQLPQLLSRDRFKNSLADELSSKCSSSC